MTASIISIEGHRLDQVLPPGAASDGRKAALCKLGSALKQHAYAFTPVSGPTHRRVNARPMAAWAHDLPGILGWRRPFREAVPSPVMLELMREAAVVDDGGDAMRALLGASTLDGQLYFHSPFPACEHDAVAFGPDEYRYVRSLRAALAALCRPVRRAADIGCGAGAGAVTVALAFPGASVFALDINPAALLLTEVNARIAGAANLAAVNSNLLNHVDGQFDLIAANLAYLREGGEPGSVLSIAVVDEAIERLAPGGTLMLYTGSAIVANADPLRMALEPRLRAAGYGWTYEEIEPDVCGEGLEQPAFAHADRIAAVWVQATRRGSTLQ